MAHQNPPTGHADEKDADRLIAAYGKKQPPEKERNLLDFLKGQKEKFLEQDFNRGKETGKGQQR